MKPAPLSLFEVADFFRTVLDELHGEDGEIPSDVDSVIVAYTQSDCWDMAAALMQVAGLPGVLVETSKGEIRHACVMTEDHRFLDASGCYTREEMGRRYGLRKPQLLAASLQRIENHDAHPDDEDRREAQIRALSVIPHLPAFQGYSWASAEAISQHIQGLPELSSANCPEEGLPAVPHVPRVSVAGSGDFARAPGLRD